MNLGELYGIFLRERGKEAADNWFAKFSAELLEITPEIMIKAVYFRFLNNKKNISLTDSIGYMLALKHKIKLFGVVKNGYEDWFKHSVEQYAKGPENQSFVSLQVNCERHRLVPHFQSSKLFLLPTVFEEAFGFVFAARRSAEFREKRRL